MTKIGKSTVDYSLLGRYPYLLLKWQDLSSEPEGSEIKEILELSFLKTTKNGRKNTYNISKSLKAGMRLSGIGEGV